MPHEDCIVDVLEGYDSVRHFRLARDWISRRKEVLKNFADSLAKRSGETFKDQGRIRFADCTSDTSRNVVSKYDVVQGH